MTARVGARPVVLGSASPARLALLRGAGIDPVVRVSGVDEDALEAELAAAGRTSPSYVCAALAEAKGRSVADAVRSELPDALVVACDSVLDLDGRAWGKPHDADEAVRRWHSMRGRTGVLRTGHTVVALGRDVDRSVSEVASTTVRFADIDDATVAAYVATGEPLHVAGAFTLDALGGAFVDGVDGDPANVVGLSLPLVRRLVEELGIRWTDLWIH